MSNLWGMGGESGQSDGDGHPELFVGLEIRIGFHRRNV